MNDRMLCCNFQPLATAGEQAGNADVTWNSRFVADAD